MDTGFETVWRRVTGSTAADDEQTKLRRWIGEEATAAEIYASLLRKTSGMVHETLAAVLNSKRKRLRQLRVLYFLRTGEILSPQPERPSARPLREALRDCYHAELSMAESYRTAAVGGKADTSAFLAESAEASERQASAVRRLLERLL